MTAIIIEGPDESGKTTLATALIGYFDGSAAYLKSPAGRDPMWSQYYNAWVGRVSSDKRKFTHILDRVPEISELVYGPIIRDTSRLNNPMASILSLPKNTKVVFCQFPVKENLQDTHVAAGGKTITQEDQIKIQGGYRVVEAMVQPLVNGVYRWYYWRRDRMWSALILYLDPVGYNSQIPLFNEALERGKEILHGNTRG